MSIEKIEDWGQIILLWAITQIVNRLKELKNYGYEFEKILYDDQEFLPNELEKLINSENFVAKIGVRLPYIIEHEMAVSGPYMNFIFRKGNKKFEIIGEPRIETKRAYVKGYAHKKGSNVSLYNENNEPYNLRDLKDLAVSLKPL